jgi:hypothetical protein
MTKRTWSPVAFIVFLASASLPGQQADVPLNNWTVPPYTHASSGITTMADVTPPRAFVGIQPCRVADTRGNGAPIQGGIFANSEARNWDVTGICGIPAGADAISVNFTVVSAAATPQGAFMLAWPTGSPPSPIVALMTYGPGVTILSNSAIVPLATGELLTVNVSHSTHVIMDVNGYFSDTLGTVTNQLLLINNISGNYTAAFGNFASADNSSGVVGTAGPGFAHPAYSNAGVRGESQATGVLGLSQTRGVLGSLVSGGGETAFGILGFQTGPRYGVYGRSFGAVDNSAGVFGASSLDVPVPNSQANAGVRGQGPVQGVLGIGRMWGVHGFIVDANGVTIAGGILGDSFSIASSGSPPWGVYSYGNLGALGVKNFVEPHPADPRRVIVYSSIEGRTVDTFFRGTARFVNREAVIEVPDDFRIVTGEEGLTVQITPIGGFASTYVESRDLHQIVVRSSKDVEFDYLVQGIRRAFQDFQPVRAGNEFVPLSPQERVPAYLTEEAKGRLVANGTYNPDGTVNMDTARRLGWDKIWEERFRPAPQPVP